LATLLKGYITLDNDPVLIKWWKVVLLAGIDKEKLPIDGESVHDSTTIVYHRNPLRLASYPISLGKDYRAWWDKHGFIPSDRHHGFAGQWEGS
jgi:hypothetical protein